MLVNLRTIHKPKTYEEAAELLKRPGVYPLYGGGASLIRMDRQDIEEAVDLSEIPIRNPTGLSTGRTGSRVIALILNARDTLQILIHFGDSRVGSLVENAAKLEVPQTLRNILTFGDLLMECNPHSMLLGCFLGLQAQLALVGFDKPILIDQWFDLGHEGRRKAIIESVYCGSRLTTFSIEKVSRTPSDIAIVAAIAIQSSTSDIRTPPKLNEPFAIVTGLADRPVRYVEGIQSQVSDYKGSAEYRTEMAKILSKRAIAKATELAKM